MALQVTVEAWPKRVACSTPSVGSVVLFLVFLLLAVIDVSFFGSISACRKPFPAGDRTSVQCASLNTPLLASATHVKPVVPFVAKALGAATAQKTSMLSSERPMTALRPINLDELSLGWSG